MFKTSDWQTSSIKQNNRKKWSTG